MRAFVFRIFGWTSLFCSSTSTTIWRHQPRALGLSTCCASDIVTNSASVIPANTLFPIVSGQLYKTTPTFTTHALCISPPHGVVKSSASRTLHLLTSYLSAFNRLFSKPVTQFKSDTKPLHFQRSSSRYQATQDTQAPLRLSLDAIGV